MTLVLIRLHLEDLLTCRRMYLLLVQQLPPCLDTLMSAFSANIRNNSVTSRKSLEIFVMMALCRHLKECDGLCTSQTNVEEEVFNCPIEIKKLLCTSDPTKLDVSAFDGNILNWRSFWEQFFCIRA